MLVIDIIFFALDCFWLLNEMLRFTANDELSSVFAEFKGNVIEESVSAILPQRMEGTSLHVINTLLIPGEE